MKYEKIGTAESRSAAQFVKTGGAELGKIGMVKSVKAALKRHSASLSPEMEKALKNHKKARFQHEIVRQYLGDSRWNNPITQSDADKVEKYTYNHEWAVRKANIAFRHDFNNTARLPENAKLIDVGADFVVRAGLFTKGVTTGIGVGVAAGLWLIGSAFPITVAALTGDKKQEKRQQLRAQYGWRYLTENIGAGAVADVKRSYKLAGLGAWEKNAKKIQWQRTEVSYKLAMHKLKEGQDKRNFWDKKIKKHLVNLDAVIISKRPPQLPPLPNLPQIEL